MLNISIKGVTDGKHAVELRAECTEIDAMFPEFFGTVVVKGELQKLGKRYILSATAECDARLVCDMSGEEFVEHIIAPLSLNYVANTNLFLEQLDDEAPEQPFYIREDDTTISITEEVRQELAVKLPAKRIAPQFRGKDFSDLHPEFDADAQKPATTDPRWNALKTISFEKKN